MVAQIDIMRFDFLNRKIHVAISFMTKANGITYAIEKIDDLSVVHDGILAGMRLNQFRQKLGKGLEVLIHFALVRLCHVVLQRFQVR